MLFNFGLIEITNEPGSNYRYRVFYRPQPNALTSVFVSDSFKSFEEAVIAAKARVLRMSVRRSDEVAILTDLKTGRLVEQSHLHRNCFGNSTHPKAIKSQDLYQNPGEREQAINRLIQQCYQLADDESSESSYCAETIRIPRPTNLDGRELTCCCSGQEKIPVSLRLYCLSPDLQLLIETFVGLNTGDCCSQAHT